MHVLGIDAGGTKTVCFLADEQGTIVSEGRGSGANLQSSGELAVEKVLHEVMETAIGDRAITPSAICLGIAGVDRENDERIVRAIMRRIGYKARILVVNDALIALVAGAQDSPGIVVIAGTGSIVYGRNTNFDAARAGGWGHIIGDEGSGYWIGREALAAIMRAADGRGPATKRGHVGAATYRLRSGIAPRERRGAGTDRPACQPARRRRRLANSRAGCRRARPRGRIGRSKARDARGCVPLHPRGRRLPRRPMAGGGVVTAAPRGRATVRGSSAPAGTCGRRRLARAFRGPRRRPGTDIQIT
ncbi:MAG: hypothetical protein DMF92_20095 [Acidobacteria bacterium]|nr:MAG: hypothetical protein DMF92_20095 [Acidobacteriota bacterium]